VTRHPSVPARSLPILLSALCAWLLATAPATAAAPDWNAVAGENTVEVVTKNEDGSMRETTVWLAVVDGQGYLRTGNTRWAANIERDPDVTLRIGTSEYPLRVEFVEDEALRERIQQSFHEKYGFTDSLASLFHMGHPKLMHLVPR
jgi:hypothetical protein